MELWFGEGMGLLICWKLAAWFVGPIGLYVKDRHGLIYGDSPWFNFSFIRGEIIVGTTHGGSNP